MKKKTLLRLVMVCLLLGCGVSGIKAQITIDKMANELEKRDDVAINSVTKRDPKTRKVIKVVKTYSVKDTKLGKRLIDAFEKDEEYAETAIKDMPKGRNAGQKANFTFIFRTDDEKRTYTLTTNESGNVSFTIIISPLKNGREVTGVDWIIENTNQQFCQTTTTIDKNGDVYLNGKRVLVVDDVISTGESLNALEELVRKAGGTIAGRAAVLAEGDAAQRDDILFLAPLPIFTEE